MIAQNSQVIQKCFTEFIDYLLFNEYGFPDLRNTKSYLSKKYRKVNSTF